MKHLLRFRLPALTGALFVFSSQVALAASRRSRSSSGDSPEWWVILLIILLMGVGIVGAIFYLERRRSKKIEEVARSLGLTFRRKATDADNALPAGCHVAAIGHGRVVSNVLEAARSAELNFTLFDYQYTIGHGKSSNTVQQTITRMESGLFRLPAFLLFPESFLAKMGKMFGKSDINFPESPEFSRKYILRGDDEAAIRTLFTPALRQTLESQDRLTIEGAGGLLFIFRKGRRLNPDQIAARLEQDKRIAALFFEAQRASGPTPPPPPPPSPRVPPPLPPGN
jgi:hypothetical protein